MPYQFPGRYFVHEDGRGRDSAFLIDQTDLTTASGLFADGFELVNIDHVPHADAVMDSPTDYLWSTIQNTAVLKPLVVWSTSNPTVIAPTASQAFSWTVTGTLPPDFAQPSTTMLTLSRHLYQAEVGEIQSEFVPNDFLLVAASGVAASGVSLTFHPNEVPGYYDFAIAQHTDLWRQAPLRVVASGTTPSLNPAISGAGQVSGWTLGVAGSDWTIYRRARRADSSNVNDLSVDYEYGAVFLQNNGAISVLDNAGVETTVDLIANDGSLDMVIYGDDTSINLTASGINSDINLTASGSTSDINLTARGDTSTINAIAEGTSTFINLFAHGTNSTVQAAADGVGSSVQLEATGNSSFINIQAASNTAGIQLIGGDVLIRPGTSKTLHLDGTFGAIDFTAGSNNIDFNSTGGGRVQFNGRTLFLNTIEAENATSSFRSPQRTAAQLTAENPGGGGGGRIAWDSTNNLFKFWDRGAWQTFASGTGGGVDQYFDRVRVADGSVGSPSITFNDDQNTGIYSATNDELDLVAGGDTLLYVSANTDQVRVTGGAAFGLPGFSNPGKDALTPEQGFLIHNLSSGTVNFYDGSSWRTLAYSGTGTSGGVTDHGALTGLSDDDHPQYFLADGTRTITGNVSIDNNADTTLSIDLEAGSTASQQIDLHFCDRGTQQFALRKNTSNNFVFRDHINSKSSVVIELGANDNTLVVDSNSRVGIGTASPTEALHVVGEGLFTGNVELKNTADAGLSFIIDSGATTTQLANFAFQDQGNGQWTIGKDTTNDFSITDLIGGVTPFTIQQSVTGDTGASIVIESTGDVGIGTGSPAYKLDVNGDIQARGGDIISDPQSGNANAGLSAISRGTGIPFVRWTKSGQTTQWRADLSGNSWRLVDEVSATAPIVVESGTQSNLLYLDANNSGTAAGTHSRVGIRTTSPSTDLHVVGSGIFTSLGLNGSSPSDSALIHATSHDKTTPIILSKAGNSEQYLEFQTGGFTTAKIGVNGSSQLSIYGLLGLNEMVVMNNAPANSIVLGTTTSAQVGIGASPASGTLHVHGTGYFNSGVSVSGTPVMLNKGGVRENRVVSTINSAAEADIINFTVPGSTFSSTNSNTMDVMIGGTYSNTSGANRTLRLRIYYGATTLYNDTTGNIATSTAGDRAWNFNLRLMPMSDPANYVYGIGTFVVGAAGATTAGQGDLGTTATFVLPVVASGNPSLASNANFRVTLTNSAALPTISFRRSLAFAQII